MSQQRDHKETFLLSRKKMMTLCTRVVRVEMNKFDYLERKMNESG